MKRVFLKHEIIKMVEVPEKLDDLIGLATYLFGFSVAHVNTEQGAKVGDIKSLEYGDTLRVIATENAGMMERKDEKVTDEDVDELLSRGPDLFFKDWVRFNVRGKSFETTKAILLKQPNSILAKMLDANEEKLEKYPIYLEEIGAFFIDSDPTYFKVLLNYLIDGQLKINPGVSRKKVFEEAQKFDIEINLIEKTPEVVCLNVNGTYFATTRATLTKQPDSLLAEMFDKDLILDPDRLDDSGAFLIDRDPTYFSVVLNYLRYGELKINQGVNLDNVLKEAEHFGVTILVPEQIVKV